MLRRVLRVHFAPLGPAVELDRGGRLLDALDELGEYPLDFPCRDASCGGCLVSLVGGGHLVGLAGRHEQDTLARLGAAEGQRLACQLTADADAGEVTLARPDPQSAG